MDRIRKQKACDVVTLEFICCLFCSFYARRFFNRFVALPELNEGLQRKLIEDDTGVVPAHSVYVKDVSKLDMSSSQVVTYSQMPNKRPPPPINFSNPLDFIRTPRFLILRTLIYFTYSSF